MKPTSARGKDVRMNGPDKGWGRLREEEEEGKRKRKRGWISGVVRAASGKINVAQ